MADLFFCLGGFCFWGRGVLMFFISGQHRTIPALRLRHRSGGCGTASALPKCSIMSGCRVLLHRASGAKALARSATAAPVWFAVSATGGARLCGIQYYLRFLGSCRTIARRIGIELCRYCPLPFYNKRCKLPVGDDVLPSSRPPGPAISPTAKTRKSLSPSHLRALL